MGYAALIAAAVAAIGMAISAGQEAQAAAIRQKLAQQMQDIPLPVIDQEDVDLFFILHCGTPADLLLRWGAKTSEQLLKIA